MAIQNHNQYKERCLRQKEVIRLTGLSSTTLWRHQKNHNFPMRRKLPSGTVYWLESEVLAWMLGTAPVGDIQ